MDHRAIRERFQAVPFRPFRLRSVDGRAFDVLHPDYLFIAPAGRWLTHFERQTQETALLEPMLIVSLEYIPQAPPAGTDGTDAT
ncbi:MAG: hypothetical protein ACRC33_12335 [Gemmataceae bacterium]